MAAFVTGGAPAAVEFDGVRFMVRGLTGEEWIDLIDRFRAQEFTENGFLVRAVDCGLVEVEGAPAELDTLEKQRAAMSAGALLEVGERIVSLSEFGAKAAGNLPSRSTSARADPGAAGAARNAPRGRAGSRRGSGTAKR